MDLLNRLFSSFDVLTEKFNVEKVKTIGDCYVATNFVTNFNSNKMAVTGCPIEDTKHAIAMAEYALAMLHAITLVPSSVL